MKHFTIINCAERARSGWNFVQDFYPESADSWHFFSAESQNVVEQYISRPKISRVRACLQTAKIARQAETGLVVSHLPRTTAMLEEVRHLYHIKLPHLAFAFNFTELPGGFMRSYMKHAFKSVDQFAVFSQFEKKRYADYFDLDTNKFQMLHWAMETPACSDYRPVNGDYICAVGGEGRDYKTLIEAFRQIPQLRLVIVTRPGTLAGLDLPENVTALFNLPKDDFWATVNNSQFVVVPLLHDEVACGHITIVGSFLLKKAVVATFSKGTTDYIQHRKNALVSQPGDAIELRDNILRLSENAGLRSELSEYGHDFAMMNCQPALWADYLYRFRSSL